MKFFINFDGEYIFSIGQGTGNKEITQEEYESILAVINNRPKAAPGFTYKLRKDLTWELVEVPAFADDDPELSDAEVLDILLGGADA